MEFMGVVVILFLFLGFIRWLEQNDKFPYD